MSIVTAIILAAFVAHEYDDCALVLENFRSMLAPGGVL